jgi:hypothetical protein
MELRSAGARKTGARRPPSFFLASRPMGTGAPIRAILDHGPATRPRHAPLRWRRPRRSSRSSRSRTAEMPRRRRPSARLASSPRRRPRPPRPRRRRPTSPSRVRPAPPSPPAALPPPPRRRRRALDAAHCALLTPRSPLTHTRTRPPKSTQPVHPPHLSTEGGKKKKEGKLGLNFAKDEDFGEWYSEVVVESEMISYYDVSGARRLAVGGWWWGGGFVCSCLCVVGCLCFIIIYYCCCRSTCGCAPALAFRAPHLTPCHTPPPPSPRLLHPAPLVVRDLGRDPDLARRPDQGARRPERLLPALHHRGQAAEGEGPRGGICPGGRLGHALRRLGARPPDRDPPDLGDGASRGAVGRF